MKQIWYGIKINKEALKGYTIPLTGNICCKETSDGIIFGVRLKEFLCPCDLRTEITNFGIENLSEFIPNFKLYDVFFYNKFYEI